MENCLSPYRTWLGLRFLPEMTSDRLYRATPPTWERLALTPNTDPLATSVRHWYISNLWKWVDNSYIVHLSQEYQIRIWMSSTRTRSKTFHSKSVSMQWACRSQLWHQITSFMWNTLGSLQCHYSVFLDEKCHNNGIKQLSKFSY